MAAKEHKLDSTRTSLLAVNGNITLSEYVIRRPNSGSRKTISVFRQQHIVSRYEIIIHVLVCTFNVMKTLHR
jgi:hypothetical protein